MSPRTTRWGLAIAAGLAWLLPATAARAQFSLGYDSFVYGAPPPQTFWYSAGYESVYTDPNTGVFRDGQSAGPRTLAPVVRPPYGTFPQGGTLPTVTTRPAQGWAPVPQAPQRAVGRRRGLILRRK